MQFSKKEYEELKRLENLKKEKAFVFEIVVPNDKELAPMSILYGGTTIKEISKMIQCLEDVTENLKKNFPEAAFLTQILHMSSGMEEIYKKVEREEK